MTTARTPGNDSLIAGVMDRLAPVVDVYKPYVDGLEHLPEDGRMLLVGNHTQGGGEVFLIPTWCTGGSVRGCGHLPTNDSETCPVRQHG